MNEQKQTPYPVNSTREKAEKPYLVVLSDYGLDDAVASLRLFSHADLFQKIDVVAVGGNVSPALSLKNAKRVAAQAKPFATPVRFVDTTAVFQPHENLYDIHGADGVGGDVFTEKESAAPVLTLAEFLAEREEIDVLLSLGPMTVTKEVLSRRAVKDFLFMAGCVDGKPNYHGYEFNHGLNKEAFAYCAKFPHRAVLLDAACKALNVQHLPLSAPDLFTRAIKKYRDLGISRGETSCTVWDDVAILALLYPALFTETVKTDRDGNRLFSLHYAADFYPGVNKAGE